MISSGAFTIWEVLDIAPTDDERDIKRAYARQLKLNRPDDDTAAFQRLRDAYETALQRRAYSQDALQRPPATEAEPIAAAPVQARERSATPETDTFRMSDPEKEAQAIWQRWLASGGSIAFQALEASAAMAHFSVREEFERLALRYCATAACHDAIRARFIEHFGWDTRTAQLQKIDREAANAMIGRQNATYSLAYLHRDKKYGAALDLLMTAPPKSSGRLRDEAFTQTLLELIELIHRQHADLLAYKLDASSLMAWERRARAKKYFTSTAVSSAFAGATVYALFVMVHQIWGVFDYPLFYTHSFFLAQGLSFAAFAAFTFYRPVALLERLAQFRQTHLDSFLEHQRHQHRWQFGWVYLYAASSLLFFVYRPAPMLVYLTGFLLTVCAALALFAASVYLKPFGYYHLLPVALILAHVMQDAGFEAFSLAACLASSMCLLILLRHSGQPLYAAIGLQETWRPRLRVTWLLGGTLLFFVAAAGILPDSLSLASVWLWFLAGLTLREFKLPGLSRYLILPALILGKFAIPSVRSFFKELPDARLAMPELMLLLLVFLILGNVYHAAQEKNIYA